jgi:hypothetical protein
MMCNEPEGPAMEKFGRQNIANGLEIKGRIQNQQGKYFCFQ